VHSRGPRLNLGVTGTAGFIVGLLPLLVASPSASAEPLSSNNPTAPTSPSSEPVPPTSAPPEPSAPPSADPDAAALASDASEPAASASDASGSTEGAPTPADSSSSTIVSAAPSPTTPAPVLEPTDSPGADSAPSLLSAQPEGRAAWPRDLGPSASENPKSHAEAPTFGLMLDAGFPDGVMASVAYRPRQWLRAYVGGGTNSVSAGIRAGFALVPFGFGPSLTVEGGWYFEGDANDLARELAGRGYEHNAMAERFGYQFANLHLGFETGGKHVNFFMHGGMSYVRLELHEADEVFGGEMTDAQGTTVVTFGVPSDPVITALVPSVKLGLVVYLV
jgi:hypothetical protein